MRRGLWVMGCGLWVLLAGWAQEVPPLLDPLPETAPTVPAPAPPTASPGAGTGRGLPSPIPSELPKGRIRVRAQRHHFSLREGLYRFIGAVSFEAGDLLLKADEVEYNAETDLAHARGNVSLKGADGNTYTGGALELNTRTREWVFRDWRVEYGASRLGKAFRGSLYVSGEEVGGTPERLRSGRATLTTCDRERPHYDLSCSEVIIIPGERVVARGVSLRLAGHRLVRLPVLVFSLKERTSPFVPEVGMNPTEGYYLHLKYQYSAGEEQYGTARVDLASKLTTGYGVDHRYAYPDAKGQLFLYGRTDESTARLRHEQTIGDKVGVTLTGDVLENSRYATQSVTSTTLGARLRTPVERPAWNLNYSERRTDGAYSSDSTTATLGYDTTMAGGRLRYSGEYSSFGQPLGADNEELWNRASWSGVTTPGLLTLRVDEREDLDGAAYAGDDNHSSLQRLPEATIEMDAEKRGITPGLPGRLTVGLGVYEEQPQATRLARALLDYRAQPRPLRFGATTVSAQGGIRQTVYGDADMTAQYVMSANLAATTRVGKVTNMLSGSAAQARGYTPFAFDTSYAAGSAMDTLSYAGTRTRASLSGGRDFRNKRWQYLAARLETGMGTKFTTRHAATYDPETGRGGDVTSGLAWRDGTQSYAEVGTRYAISTGRLRQVTGQVSLPVGTLWRVRWVGGYDVGAGRSLYNEVLLTRDLHCWDASLYYSEQTRSYRLYLRLKALDIPIPQFGVGSGGQMLGAGGPGMMP